MQMERRSHFVQGRVSQKLSASGGQGKPRRSMEHRPRAAFSSFRDPAEYVFFGRALVKNQKASLECSVIKFPFHMILETISGRVFY
jgi:hypothetical protein